MTKTEKVKNFLNGKTFPGCAQAMQMFQAQENETITYPQFNQIWRTELAKNSFTVVEEVKVSTNTNTGLAVVPVEQKEVIKLYSPAEIDGMFDESILIPFKSNTPLDNIISSYGGLLPATIAMIPGESGVGKSTLLLHFISCIKAVDDVKVNQINDAIIAANAKLKKNVEPAPLKRKMKLLLVSSEMNAIHQYKYQRRVKLAELDVKILFLGQYEFPHDVLERELAEGYDIVILDSFADTINKVCYAAGMSPKQAESWLLRLMDRIRLKDNKLGVYTSFLCTQHMTKGGEYTGSTNVKHMTDSMMRLAFDDNEQTYIEFNKNRDGSIKKRLYYKLSEAGVTFDLKRFEKDADIKAQIESEVARKEESAKRFDEILALGSLTNNDAHLIGESTNVEQN